MLPHQLPKYPTRKRMRFFIQSFSLQKVFFQFGVNSKWNLATEIIQLPFKSWECENISCYNEIFSSSLIFSFLKLSPVLNKVLKRLTPWHISLPKLLGLRKVIANLVFVSAKHIASKKVWLQKTNPGCFPLPTAPHQ